MMPLVQDVKRFTTGLRARTVAILFGLLIISGPGRLVAATDLARAPLNFLISSKVKPNIYFILDDSGSMNWSYMGDEVVRYGYEKTIGYRSHRCNKIYYNPGVIYPRPVRPDGTLYPAQSFTKALYNGFSDDSVKVDLSSSFTAWRTYTSKLPVPTSTDTLKYRSECFTGTDTCTSNETTDYPNVEDAAYYFVYQGDKAANLGDNTALDACLDKKEAPNWTKVVVSARSGPNGTDERTNFANWFSYHRTRMLTTRTAIGRAFRDLDENFRVGYSTLGESSVDSAQPGFLKIADFNPDQKSRFYEKLYSVDPTAGTPLRAALSKAGRIYAGKLLLDADDPVRFSCQQNFTILSTDGYWNSNGEAGIYGPKKIDGLTDVGDQDRDLPRPMNDGDPDGNPVLAAKLVLTARPGSTDKIMVYDSISVDGVELLPFRLGLTRSSNLDNDLWWLGNYLETVVSQRFS